jgi:integrase
MPRQLKGIRRRRNAWRAFVNVKGKVYTKTFPLTTPIEEMSGWREMQQKQFGGTQAVGRSFTEDIAWYLTHQRSMPTYAQRVAHLALWAQALGRDRRTDSITETEIDLILQGWLTAGLANGTVRKRRTALQSFFVKLNGAGGTNPVKGTRNPKPPKPEARALDYLVIERILAAMPIYRDVAKGTARQPSHSTIRARVMAYTGLPPGILATIVPDDLSFSAATVHVVPRGKGAGIEARTLSLTPEALAAFKDFHAANAYGDFAIESLNRAFKRAVKKIGLNPRTVHLYDLRHSFLTQLYRTTGDEATVARLGLHAEGSPITKRYTMGAHRDVDEAAVAAFSATLATKRQEALKPAIRQTTGSARRTHTTS